MYTTFKRSETIRSGAQRAKGFIISGITEEKLRGGRRRSSPSHENKRKNPSVEAHIMRPKTISIFGGGAAVATMMTMTTTPVPPHTPIRVYFCFPLWHRPKSLSISCHRHHRGFFSGVMIIIHNSVFAIVAASVRTILHHAVSICALRMLRYRNNGPSCTFPALVN